MAPLILLLLTTSIWSLSACAPIPPPSAPVEEGVEADEAEVMPEPGEEPKGEGAVMKKEAVKEAVMVKDGVYAPYAEGVIGNGETSVLYFKADWCPKCVAQHAALSASYDYPLSTYYLDYDTALQLRARYGVVTQHTFVKINGDGNLLAAVSFPSAQALAQFLSK